MKTRFFSLSILAGLASIGAAQTYFHDDFSSSSQLNYYGTDREAPKSLTTGTYFGKTAADLTVWDDSSQTDGFYDFQGIQRYADTGHTTSFGLPVVGSRLSMDIYIPSSWNGTTGGSNDKRGGDLWARYSDPRFGVGDQAYPTVGFYNEGNGNGLGVETYDGYAGVTTVYSLSTLSGMGANVNLDGWNNLALSFDGTALNSYVNGVLIRSDSDSNWAHATGLEAAFVQGWRPLSWIGTQNTYDVVFTNVQTVPEPASFAILGIGGLALLRRRKKA